MAISKVVFSYPNPKWQKHWEGRTAWHIHPYNIGLLSAMTEEKYEVSLVDANIDMLTKDQYAEALAKEKPDVVGISILTNEYAEAGHIAAELVKQVDQNIKVVMGGVHVTTNPNSVMANLNVDFSVRGEGEYVFRELLDFLNGDGEFPKQGVLYRKNGNVVDTGRAPFIMDLNALPLISYKHLNFMKYGMRIQREDVGRPRAMPHAHTVTTRGCPYHCSFCEVWYVTGRKMRMRSVENIISELEFLIHDYGVKSMSFDDDHLLMDKERSRKLFQTMIDRKFDLKWNAPALAVYELDEGLIKLMEDSGCQYANVAVESGVERVLKDIIHKPLELGHAKKMIRALTDSNIYTCVNFCIGFPGETWDEIMQTIRFAEELDTDYIKLFIATPLPNTELYRIAKEKGYLVKGFDFNKHWWTDGSIRTPEFRPQDLKILRAYMWDYINFSNLEKKKKTIEAMGVSEERLNQIRKETLKRANP